MAAGGGIPPALSSGCARLADAPDPARWGILALLFAARTVMAMQYQAIGALSPVLTEAYLIGLAEIGVLIGLYVSPGLVFALPGSGIGQRFGEKPVVLAALLLMAGGAVAMAVAPNWQVFAAGHLLAGVGGVLVNVLMTKMVADWFVGAEITTALAVFINSWPFGIALSLVLFPPLVAAAGLAVAFWLLAALSLGVFALMLAIYRSPAGAGGSRGPRAWPGRLALRAALSAGVCWGAFNGGLAILFGLGTVLLVSRGVGAEEAARKTSLILWVLAVAAPFGGVLADRTGRGREMIVVGLLGLAILSPLALVGGLTAWVFLVYGALSGLVAGPIMSLPARVLAPSERILGMGMFFTIYYAIFISAPAFGGWLAEATGGIGAAFWCAGALQAAALLGLAEYTRAGRAAESRPNAA